MAVPFQVTVDSNDLDFDRLLVKQRAAQSFKVQRQEGGGVTKWLWTQSSVGIMSGLMSCIIMQHHVAS